MTTRKEDIDHAARLASRVRRLTDPAAAKGQRSARERIQQERRIRNRFAIAVLGLFVAATGFVASISMQANEPDQVVIEQVTDARRPTHIRSESS